MITDEVMSDTEVRQFVESVSEIKVTIGQLLNAVGQSPAPGLPADGPLVRIFNKRFPEGKGRLAFQVKRVVRDVLKEIETFEPIRKGLWEKYGTLTEDKKQYVVPPEKLQDFYREMNEAQSAEIVLHHPVMPELREFWEVSPAEDELLTWLVGEAA